MGREVTYPGRGYSYEYNAAGNLLSVKDNATGSHLIDYSDFTAEDGDADALQSLLDRMRQRAVELFVAGQSQSQDGLRALRARQIAPSQMAFRGFRISELW